MVRRRRRIRLGAVNWPVRAQNVRLLDVFLIGPLMMYLGAEATPRKKIAGPALLLAGAGTILYNGANYLANRREGNL